MHLVRIGMEDLRWVPSNFTVMRNGLSMGCLGVKDVLIEWNPGYLMMVSGLNVLMLTRMKGKKPRQGISEFVRLTTALERSVVHFCLSYKSYTRYNSSISSLVDMIGDTFLEIDVWLLEWFTLEVVEKVPKALIIFLLWKIESTRCIYQTCGFYSVH